MLHTPCVFIVDDEAVIATTLATILRRQGLSVEFFTDPLQALKTARTNPPDLLISDVVMPGMSGIELAQQMKAACPDTRILLFSAQAEDLLAGSSRDHFEILQKPIHPLDLIGRIKGLGLKLLASLQRQAADHMLV